MSVDQRWEALYRRTAERVKEMQNHILSLEQEVHDWMRVAELRYPVAISAQADNPAQTLSLYGASDSTLPER